MEFDKGSVADLLKATAKEAFITLIKKITGNKDLVLTDKLIGTLDMICGFTTLKSNGVEKIYKLESEAAGCGQSKNQCFVITPTLTDTKRVADCILESKQNNCNHSYWVIFVPRCIRVCDLCLEREGVYNDITILEYPLGLVPLDTDLFSLESNDFFVDCFLHNDQTGLPHISNSLEQLQHLVGLIPNWHAKGNASKKVLNISAKNTEQDKKDSLISNIILFDRDCDYTSILLSPLNYQGLLDEFFSIKNGKIEVGPEVLKNENNSTKHIVNSGDPIFCDIRDVPFYSVFLLLKEKGTKLKTAQEKTKSLNLSDMKEFIANKLKILQAQNKSLNLHFSACEFIMEQKKRNDFGDQLRVERNIVEGVDSKESFSFIEERIIRQELLTSCLKLMILYSYSQDGLSSSTYKKLVTLFLHSFGQEHLFTLFNLKKLGLLTEFSQTSSPIQITPNNSLSNSGIANKMTTVISANRKFRTLVKRLNLIPPLVEGTYDVRNPPDPGYVFGGAYIPLICKVLEIFIVKSLSEDFLKFVPGENAVVIRQTQNIPTVLVYFIGGVTLAEVSALRFFAKQKGIKILIATTSIINANNFLKQLMPQL